ncbi:MAG: hypothetical protein EWV72_09050 [Microcystis flos-aquae Mf_QC_C_20070823_S10]|nr:MAG: hypothetical protein EWV72_09050 [Microcystis flos-aquae Mf_QC_C_20070823_S10]
MSDAPLIKGGLKGGLRGDRHPPYQGGQGGSNLKSIFNLIITCCVINRIDHRDCRYRLEPNVNL